VGEQFGDFSWRDLSIRAPRAKRQVERPCPPLDDAN
jgi:hypothetical protein